MNRPQFNLNSLLLIMAVTGLVASIAVNWSVYSDRVAVTRALELDAERVARGIRFELAAVKADLERTRARVAELESGR